MALDDRPASTARGYRLRAGFELGRRMGWSAAPRDFTLFVYSLVSTVPSRLLIVVPMVW
jgi:hypothetical protein